MELTEVHDGERVTTTITVTADELADLRTIVTATANAVAQNADDYPDDEACKAALAKWIKYDNKLRTAQIRTIKKRAK